MRQEVITEALKAIKTSYKVNVIQLPVKPLSGTAYYKPRHRYRAEKLLYTLETAIPSGTDKIIGLTEVDISATKGKHADWGLFGLGSMPGQACVVSTHRLHAGVSQAKFHERLRKVVVHELGHTFGREHCTNKGCLMNDARGQVRTVDNENSFCVECRAQLNNLLK